MTRLLGQLLLERESELSAIEDRTTAAMAGAGSALLVEGQPGIGKSTILAAAAQLARERDLLVLRASGAELEQTLSWGVVRSVLGAQLADAERRERLLQGAAQAVAPLFTAATAQPAGDTRGAILHGLYWLISDMAASRPLVIVVDDVHWADAPSVMWLAHLCARIDDLPVLLVMGARPVPGAKAWQSMASLPAARPLKLAPLSAAGTRALVTAKLGPGHEQLSDECHTATAGNPFLVEELLRHIVAAPDRPQVAVAIRDLRPETIRRAVLLRLAQLGEDATQLCFAIAVLGQEATVPLAAELAAVPGDRAGGALDALVAGEVITIGERPAFVHPLVLAVVRDELPAAQRGQWHGTAAGLLAARGATPDVVAAHLLATEPAAEATTVEWLRRAAAEALAVGAPRVAASYLSRALAEPPPDAALNGVLLELGRALGWLADANGVIHLRRALARATDPVQRGQIALELAGQLLRMGALREVVELGQAAAVALPEEARQLRLELLAQARTAAGQVPEVPVEGLLELNSEELLGTTRGERVLLAATANLRMARSMASAGALHQLAGRALADGALLRDVGAASPQFWGAATTALFAERYDEYEQLLSDAARDSGERGSASGYGSALCFGSPLHYRLGRLAEAADDARGAIGIFGSEPLMHCFALGFLLEALIDQGELEAADAAIQTVDVDQLPGVRPFARLRGARARLLRARGSAGEAARELLVVGQQLREVSPVFWPWRAEAALALAAVGESEQARALATEELRRGELAGSRWVQVQALHALGITERSTEPLERAESLTRSWPTRLERARVLVALGASLRRERRQREAVPFLQEALDLADRCGAHPIGAQASEELLMATGAKPHRARISGPASLTPGELRVSRLAAAGRSNREIAQALFVSLRTVETHLTRSYDKLQISGRDQLSAALADES